AIAAKNNVVPLARSAKPAGVVPPTQKVPKRSRLIGRANGRTLILSPLLPVIEEIPYETLRAPDRRCRRLRRRRARRHSPGGSPVGRAVNPAISPSVSNESLENQPRAAGF